jgi:hypothetical protein
MHFLNPWYLLGLVFASIPIVIHLLIIRKSKTIDFSSIRFLKELQKTQIRRLKLKQILLLILRTLIIVFIVLAFARPVIKSDFPLLSSYSNISAVIVLDNSISMDISDEYGNRFRQARNFVTQLLDQMKDGDQIALITTTDKTPNAELTSDFKFIKDEVNRMNISAKSSSYETSLRLAQKELTNAKNFYKEVFIISDFQKSALQNFVDSLKLFDSNTDLNFVQIGANSKLPINNVSIDSVVPLTRIYELGKNVDFEVFLSNSSKSNAENLVLSFFMNGERISQRLFNIEAKGKQKVIIGGTIKHTGVVRCLFEIENDALEYDKKKWLGFIVPEALSVGLVSEKETGYIASFLKSLNDEKIKYKFIAPSELPKADLSGFSALIFESPIQDDQGLSNIKRFLNSGKGLLVFPPVSFNLQQLQKFFSTFGINTIFEEKNFQPSNTPNFTFIDNKHPLLANVFSPSSEKATTLPDPPKISKLLSVRSGLSIIQTNAGPFLTEFTVEGSKVLFCSVAPSEEWGNFPLTSLFPVIIYRSIYYLSETNEYNLNVFCGEPITLTLPKGLSPTNYYKLQDPLNNVNAIQAVQLPSGHLFQIEDLTNLGTYFLNNSEDKPIGTISVNTDPRESQLEFADKEQILSFFKNYINNNSKMNYIENFRKFDSKSFREHSGTELWRIFLLLTILAVLLEMYVARTLKNEVTE